MPKQTTITTDNQRAHDAAQAGRPTDAVEAFRSAITTAIKTPPADTADPAVSLAFALGWQMAELFRPHLRRTQKRDGDLPGLGSLGDDQRLEITVDQIQAAVFQLTPSITKAGLAAPTPELNAVRAVLGSWDASGAATVEALHIKLLGVLTAADFRLGKAYGLGRALADTCRKPTSSYAVRAQLNRYRIANLLAWLDELSTALPPHAAHSVYTSLQNWRDWVAACPQLPDSTTVTLRRQGELWRTLLSGEKHGTEMLEVGNYLDAAGHVASRMNTIFWRTVARFGWLCALAVLLLAGGVYLLAVGGSSKIVAGAGTVVVALGLTWKGIGGSLGKLAGKLEQPVWGAVLDAAIADAITLQPGNKADRLGRAALAHDLANGSAPALSGSSAVDGKPMPGAST